jgi:ketopantoate reductase
MSEPKILFIGAGAIGASVAAWVAESYKSVWRSPGRAAQGRDHDLRLRGAGGDAPHRAHTDGHAAR